jgi:hypothetical protein
MISEILQEVHQRGLLGPYQTRFISNLLRHIKLFYIFPNGHGLFLKITNGLEAKQEYCALKHVRNLLGGHVPEPLLLVEDCPHTAFVTSLVQHRDMMLKDLQKKGVRDQLGTILSSSLTSDHDLSCFKPLSPEDIQNFCENDHVTSDFPKWALVYVQNAIKSIWQELPQCAQHGDLVLYNLGINKDTVVLFDWEDHGKIGFGGYDIATFIFSLIAAQDAFKLVSRDPNQMFDVAGGQIVLDVLDTNRINPQLFLKYFPFLILCFLYLKKKLVYGSGTVDRTTSFLRSLFISNIWKRLMLSV